MREYSSRRLWSTVGGKVVIPEAIAEYLESFQRGGIWTMNDKEDAARRICNVGWGHWVEGSTGEKYDFGEDHKKYHNMFGGETRFHILRALMDGYVVHAPKVAVRFGKKFAKSSEVDSELTSMTYRWMPNREDEYGYTRSYVLTLSDYPEPWNYRDALKLQEDFGGEIVKYE